MRRDGGEVAQFRALFHDDMVFNDAGRPDTAIRPNLDRPDDHLCAFEGHIGKFGAGADGRVCADRDEIDGADLQFGNIGVLPDLAPSARR